MSIGRRLLLFIPVASALLGNLTDYPSYVCPPGFDCWNQNSCPSIKLSCPTGYYCGDFSEESSVTVGGDDELERDEWCPLGTRCPTTERVLPCSEGRWCDAASTTGIECDPAGICPENSWTQNRVFPLIIMGIITAAFFVLSALDPGIRGTDKSGNSNLQGVDEFTNLNFHCDNVSITLPNGKTILHPVTADFNAGELIAIMGPSGAGKSTVMRAIMTNKHDGNLTINGEDAGSLPYKSTLGFVPQDDIVDPLLTAREVLTYAAQTRLPRSWSAQMINTRVDMVLKQLDLWHVQNTRVGDKITRGLSGGEKKRVSIGIELVANPSAIFLDEPTSGLDASSAEQLSVVLAGVAKTGRCVVAVIHQPRQESFLKYQKLLLMGKGGHVVYFGESKDIGEYFASVDPELACPPGMNIANHVLDIVNGVYDNNLHRKSMTHMPSKVAVIEEEEEDEEEAEEEEKEVEDKKEGEDEKNIKTTRRDRKQSRRSIHSIKKPVLAKDLPQKWVEFCKSKREEVSKCEGKSEQKKRSSSKFHARDVGIMRMAYAMTWRSLLVWLRDTKGRTLITFLSMLLALILSVGFTPYLQNSYVYEPPLPASLQPWCPSFLDCTVPASVIGLEQLLFFLTVSMGSITGMVGARLFSGDILIIKREGEAGVSTLLQGIVKLFVDLISVVLYSAIFAGTWVTLGHPGKAQDWFNLCIAIGVASSGIGTAVSLTVSRENSLLVATVLSLVFAAFSGIYPRYRTLGDAQGFWDLFYSRWTAEATYTLYTDHLEQQGQDIQRGADDIGFTIGRFGYDIGIMWVLGFAYRVIGLVILVWTIQGEPAIITKVRGNVKSLFSGKQHS
mmetsp:Transcript_11853/g.17661  ORF Transcript_11853/g.17661 Transcript_11853/m.17661 type:complete len:842 (+) Transcript_11853:92-2617(+)|eukprot:CAMPEP_0167751818 /NCGR_PEP_ID=MMETSP0110_2-20121227/6791_1 /TAXON_ID=629695 /ORGANISM="Gymnochlora sp., Strain CCMP2014" /LENGTH=841 /DNA_ID=CAMNT_0007637359 /DNA_START=80 /DNA_END=2605 /DNA_ORIENTATION=-